MEMLKRPWPRVYFEVEEILVQDGETPVIDDETRRGLESVLDGLLTWLSGNGDPLGMGKHTDAKTGAVLNTIGVIISFPISGFQNSNTIRLSGYRGIRLGSTIFIVITAATESQCYSMRPASVCIITAELTRRSKDNPDGCASAEFRTADGLRCASRDGSVRIQDLAFGNYMFGPPIIIHRAETRRDGRNGIGRTGSRPGPVVPGIGAAAGVSSVKGAVGGRDSAGCCEGGGSRCAQHIVAFCLGNISLCGRRERQSSSGGLSRPGSEIWPGGHRGSQGNRTSHNCPDKCIPGG